MMLTFREDSKSAAMIKHSMDMIWKAVNHLNKGQPIVVALDQTFMLLPSVFNGNGQNSMAPIDSL